MIVTMPFLFIATVLLLLGFYIVILPIAIIFGIMEAVIDGIFNRDLLESNVNEYDNTRNQK